ncbi:hypothetical protein ILYODFUR_015982 [Ilyodon furcidens]|uniref:Uncharacterized protein n=1 Tax=Ilyodon furcidens TaxID=33524 RepID=A0ABV0SYU2_9TELE
MNFSSRVSRIMSEDAILSAALKTSVLSGITIRLYVFCVAQHSSEENHRRMAKAVSCGFSRKHWNTEYTLQQPRVYFFLCRRKNPRGFMIGDEELDEIVLDIQRHHQFDGTPMT